MLERVAIDQMPKHCDNYRELNGELQRAYRGRDIETAFLKACDDILRGFEDPQVTAMALHYLNTAFDTADHKIFRLRIFTDFAIDSPALEWMKIYLDNRSQIYYYKWSY